MSADMSQVEAEGLLKAGAVLPPDTTGGGERAVPLTARTYRHPALDDRVVVRLVTEELGKAEDLAVGFLGLEPAAEPAVVGVGLRQGLGFPEWVLVHYPEDGHHALAVVPELERIARQAKTKPKFALDGYMELARQLASAVPHFLPTFYEQVARVFLAVENAAYAGQMFSKARAAEAEYGLTIDEERLDTAFLEFALAGALPVKALSGYAKDLAARVTPEEALRRFTKLCVRRTAGGLQPSAQMATDLRKLARAAGANADAEEQAYLAELLPLSATLLAPHAWWKAHSKAIGALGKRDPAVRGKLLNLTPQGRDQAMFPVWLDILELSGAVAGLHDGSLPAGECPEDGSLGWLIRFLKARDRAYGVPPSLPALYALIERMADQLRAEAARPNAPEISVQYDVDLLDLLLSLGLPVADPGPNSSLYLEHWAKGEDRRDLLALSGDGRFRDAFHKAADGFHGNSDGNRAVRVLAASPGGRPMLADWMRTVARRSSAAGLPQLPDALSRLNWLPGEALLLAPDEVREAARTDLAPVLARTLRAGLFDELGWPDWEDAVANLVPRKDIEDAVVADAWPHVIVAGASQVRVLGAEGTVLTHDLRIPAKDLAWSDPSYHYVDGELLVYWRSRHLGDGFRGYWHTSADRLLTMDNVGSTRGTRLDYYRATEAVTLPMPGGGRITGTAVLHKGDTSVPAERRVITDGVSFWVWEWDHSDSSTTGWYEYDPATGECGRRSMPGFLADALRDAPEGSTFTSGWVLPAPSDAATPAGAPVGGLLGWRTVTLPDGSTRGEDLAGRTVVVPSGLAAPARALTFPGDDRPRAVVRNGYRVSLVDPDGVVTSEAKTDDPPGDFGAGTLILPPVRYWHFFQPRDLAGSVALRAIDRDTAEALLRAAATPDIGEEELQAQIRTLLPQISHDALVAGIAGVARFAAKQQAVLDSAATRLDEALAGGHQEQSSTGPADKVLDQAFNGIGGSGSHWWWGGEDDDAFRQLRALEQAQRQTQSQAQSQTAGQTPGQAQNGAHDQAGNAAGEAAGNATGETPAVGPLSLSLPSTALTWLPMVDDCAALMFRAATVTMSEEHRSATHEWLRQLDALGLPGTASTSTFTSTSTSASATGDAEVSAARGAEGHAHPWRWFKLHVGKRPLGLTDEQDLAYNGLALGGGAFIAFMNRSWNDNKGHYKITALSYDPSGRFEVPQPFEVRSSSPIAGDRQPGWVAAYFAELAERGPAPWRPEAAEEFARLTGVSETTARLVVAGLPYVDTYQRTFLPADVRKTIGVKVADAATVKDQLKKLDVTFRRKLVGALLPQDPAKLWTDGPDVAAAAAVWIAQMGQRVSIPESLLGEATRLVHTWWGKSEALSAIFDPAASPEMSVDLAWEVRGDRVRQVDEKANGFTSYIFRGVMPLMAWLAHRLPAGDPLRAPLPAALAAVRERLANPDMVLDFSHTVSLPDFRKVAGTPTETGKGYERYGPIIMATHDDWPCPGIRTALLDPSGSDPYLAALAAMTNKEEPVQPLLEWRIAQDARFAELLADPGEPPGGAQNDSGDGSGTWWPQDPARSVPELVVEVAKEHGLSEDAAALYLMLLAMPDPTDRNVARWTGWQGTRQQTARFKGARAELAETDLVVEATRARAGRSLFLPGGWAELKSPHLPLERWKFPLFPMISSTGAARMVIVPVEPVADLYRKAWQRVRDGDLPRFEELKVKRTSRRR